MDNLNIIPNSKREGWEQEPILDCILAKDPIRGSKVVLNLLRAYPEMETEVPGMTECCLVLKILHLAFNNEATRDIIGCRLLNKAWDKAFTIYLNYLSLKNLKKYLKGCCFDNSSNGNGITSVRKFMEDMKHCPPSRNPFVAKKRLIIFKLCPFDRLAGRPLQLAEKEAHYLDCRQFLVEATRLLEKYKNHIWNFKIEYDCAFYVYKNPILWNYIGSYLRILRGLRYFSLIKNKNSFQLNPDRNGQPKDSEFIQYLLLPLPSLPHLEVLTVGCNTMTTCATEVQLLSNLLKKYSQTLKILRLKPSGFPQKGDDFFRFLVIPESISFPHLRGLSYFEEQLNYQSVNYIVHCLLDIKAPNLEQMILETRQHFWDQATPINRQQETKEWKLVLQKLKMFPILTHFKINYCFNGGEEDLFAEEDSVLSVQFLQMYHFTNATYQMLTCFPNLRYLRIIKAPIIPTAFPRNPTPNHLEINIQEEIQFDELYQSNVWSKLVKLETIKLIRAQVPGDVSSSGEYFTREEYSRMEKAFRTRFHFWQCFPFLRNICN